MTERKDEYRNTGTRNGNTEWVGVLLALVVGCRARGDLTAAPVVEAAAPVASVGFDAGTHPVAASITSIVHAWNVAINAHDADAVGLLYADQVELYGQVVARDKAVGLKRAAFAGHVRDDIDGIVVDDKGRASFHKKSTLRGGKVIDVQGYLDVAQGKIASEGDTTTDRNLVRARGVSCESALMDLVMATAEAKKAAKDLDDGIAKAHDPSITRGMMAQPLDDPHGAWDVGICESRPDRMPCYEHFEVNPAAGTILHSSYGSEPKPVVADPAQLAKARATCVR